MSGVTVQLYSADGMLLAEQVTDANGHYLFDNLPAGDYQVKFIPPAGYQLSPQVDIADFADSDANPQTGWAHLVSLDAGELDPTIDAGIFPSDPPAALGNLVWFDTDKDGVQDGDELGVAGVLVTLYREDGSIVDSMVTDADGLSLFENLLPGNYYVGFTTPAAYGITTIDALGETGNDQTTGGTTDSDADLVTGRTAVTNLIAGERDLTWDLGLTLPEPPASLGDYVWIDLDGDGVQEEGEPPLAGVEVTLYSAEGTPLSTTTTDENGYYRVSSLPDGSYYVGFMPSAGYTPTLADSGSDDAADSDADPVTGRTPVITLAVGAYNPTIHAGFQPLLSLGNLVFNDFRNNGLFDPTEDYGIDGVLVKLYRVNPDSTLTYLESTVTADGGHFLFTELPGDYVVELGAENFVPSGLLNQFVSSLYSKANPGAEPFVDPDNDVNNDDNGFESTLPDGNRVIRSQPMTLAYGTEPVNDGDLNPTSNLSMDFGVYDPAMGDLIWYDLDQDGNQDAGEVGVDSVAVELYADSNNNGVWDPGDQLLSASATDAEGLYQFSFLPPGEYIVRIPEQNFAPGGPLYNWNLSPGGSDPDNDNNTDSNGLDDGQGGVVALPITLTSGGEPTNDGDNDEFTNLTLDFGFWAQAAQFGDRVWIESDTDGLASTGVITPVAGIVIAATDGANVYTTTTSAQGYYSFTVTAGTYTVTYGSVASSYGNVVPSSTPGGNSESGNEGAYQEGGNPDQSHANGTVITVGPGEANWSMDFAFRPQAPSAITLLSFTARSDARGVVVEWVTGSEMDTWGFHLWRSSTGSRSDAERVTTRLVPAAGSPSQGAVYVFVDTTVDTSATVGTRYTYWLQEMEIDGSLHEYGPVVMNEGNTPFLGERLYLPLIGR